MESRVSNLETKFDDFKTSQSSRFLLGVVDSHERAMESRVKNAETTLADLQKEIKFTNELILQMLQFLSERVGVGSSSGNNLSKGTHTDSKIREGLNPNLGPNFGRLDSCRTSNPPFIKMVSHISVLKSDEIVLKLQAFHNEKIKAREKVDEFLSQYCPKYKLKSPPCLQPTLKKFKRVRDYANYHEDGSARFRFSSKFQESFGLFRRALVRKNEKVFDLLDKQVDDSVESPLFLDSDCKTSTTNNLVSGFPVSNCEIIRMEKKVVALKLLAKKGEDSLLCDVGLCSFPEVGSFPNIVLISVAKSGENDAHHVYVGRQQTTDIVSLKLGFHEFIRDKGGGLPKDKIWKDHSRISRYKIGTILIFSCTNESANATAYNKNGTVCLSEFDSMDLLAIWELGFTLNAENRNFSEEIDLLLVHADQTRIALQVFDERSRSVDCDFQLGYHMPISDTGGTLCRVFTSNVQIKDAHSSKFFVCDGEVMKNGTLVHLKLGFHELIRDKGGTISQGFFNSKSKNKDCVPGSDCSKVFKCEVSFDSSMIIDGEAAGYLGLHHLEACLDKNRKNGSKFTFSIFETSFYVVVHCDMCYCKGIRDKGGGSKFRKSAGDEEKMVNLYFNWIGLPSSLPTNEESFVKNVLQKKKMAMDEFLMSEKLTLRLGVEEFINLSLYTQLVNDTGLSSVMDEQLVKEAIKAVSAEKQRMAEKVAPMLQLSVDWRWVLKGQALKLSSFADQILQVFQLQALLQGSFYGGKPREEINSKTSKMQNPERIENYLVCRYYQALNVEGTQLDMSVIFQFILLFHVPCSCLKKHLGPQVHTTVPLLVITDVGNLQDAPVAIFGQKNDQESAAATEALVQRQKPLQR